MTIPTSVVVTFISSFCLVLAAVIPWLLFKAVTR